MRFVLSLLTVWLLQLTVVQGAATSDAVCGQRKVISSRIVGGHLASNGSWPWQVSIFRGGSHICGGSLIAEQWVMSSAHCYFGSLVTYQYDVVLGITQLKKPTDSVVESKVKQIFSYPDYDGQSGDIALLKLMSPVEFTDYIFPVCLPDSSVQFPPEADCWVTGWGMIRPGVPLPPINTLQELNVSLINRTACNSLYNSNLNISLGEEPIKPDMICAGYLEGGNGTCMGDSGGALACKLEGGWTQVGIVSWGRGCALRSYPGVYASVPFYANWINETMAANDDGKNGGLHHTSTMKLLLLSFALALL
ncbi:serine protease 33-like [Elgaria multicarinata webbii]|uniref:serine protease 33-like n=1 Tax=Elgaria multicarinata webbii TaxID=159646 RepID=UPI002FCCEFBD